MRRNGTRSTPDQLGLFPGLVATPIERDVGTDQSVAASASAASDPDTLEPAALDCDALAPAALARQATAADRIVTIPAYEPFLPTLARALLDGTLPSVGDSRPRHARAPLDLSAITLLLPTRRAARGLQMAFLDASDAGALLLPTIRPIAEGDDDLGLLAGLTGVGDASELALGLPPAVPELERQLVLTKLVLQWSAATAGDGGRSAGVKSPAQAVALARELSRLIDMAETEGVSLDRLGGLLVDLVREDFSEHWQQTLDFLQIVTTWWPAYLASAQAETGGAMSAVARRNQLILGEAARLRAMPPSGPVIVAGVTGSIPATVELMRAVADLPNGALVLPGLDTSLDEESWQAITGTNGTPAHPEHPQFGLKTLLDRLGLDRRRIRNLSRKVDTSQAVETRLQRARLVSEALRPSATTARWLETIAVTNRAAARRAIAGVTLIEAPSAQDEAEAIAIILREVAETPGRTAALVSPDRLLARRVAIRLEAWGIRVDDSAGRPLRKTPPGALLDLAITAIAEEFAPRPLMALLKHPLTRLGLDPFVIRRSARALEIAVFRAPYLGRGLDGIAAALAAAERDCALGPESRTSRRSRAAIRLFAEDWQAARDLVAQLADAYAPLVDLWQTAGPHALAAHAAAHVAVAEALAALPPIGETTPDDATGSPVWQGEAGAVAHAVLDALSRPELPAPELRPTEYPDVYRALVAAETVRPRIPVHGRLSIWGPLEARLQQPDVVVLGGLNDGTWPESADPGPWLNRPMRAALGLPAPEEKIGYAAHDFATLMGAPRVFLTRAQKIDGVPTVASRWLMRFEALLGGIGLGDALREGWRDADDSTTQGRSATYLAWSRQRDEIATWTPVARPAPRPPLELRPRQLSVSAVETWIGNPYAIFVQHILRLEPLPLLGTTPDASIRGAIVHEAMARFAQAYPAVLPVDTRAELLARADAILAEWTAHPAVAAFWQPRFERFAEWFAQTEARRRGGARVLAEVPGKLELVPPSGRPFVVTARADRLDVSSDGGIVITDYKTGTPPKAKAVATQRKPQLPLEGAILSGGGFREGAAGAAITGQVTALRYIQASGGEPAGLEFDIKPAGYADLDGLLRATTDGLLRHIARFDDPATPYAVTRRGGFSYDYDAFAQLARVAEWSASGAATSGGDDDGFGEEADGQGGELL